MRHVYGLLEEDVRSSNGRGVSKGSEISASASVARGWPTEFEFGHRVFPDDALEIGQNTTSHPMPLSKKNRNPATPRVCNHWKRPSMATR